MTSKDGSGVEEDVHHLYVNSLQFHVKDWNIPRSLVSLRILESILSGYRGTTVILTIYK